MKETNDEIMLNKCWFRKKKKEDTAKVAYKYDWQKDTGTESQVVPNKKGHRN